MRTADGVRAGFDTEKFGLFTSSRESSRPSALKVFVRVAEAC